MKKDMYNWLLIARGLKDRGMLTKENGQYVAKPEMGQLVLFPQLEKKVGDIVTLSKDIPEHVVRFGDKECMLSVKLPNGDENWFFGYHFRVSQLAD